MKTIRVFVSSPGDVRKERKIADRLVRSIAAEFGIVVSVTYSSLLMAPADSESQVEVDDGTLVLCPYFWEYQRFRPDEGYQEQIPNTAEFDLVICILWSRLGTQLAPKFVMPDGSRPRSGTDYEIEWARHQSKKTGGIPELHVYRNRTTPNFPPEPEDLHQELVDQWRSLKTFFNAWMKDSEGYYRAAFNNYHTLDEFEDLFRTHFRDYLLTRLDKQTAQRMLARKVKQWEENPFRGLEVFEFEHAAIFHGRTKAIGELLDLLNQLASTGTVFLLVLGASGSGKSSLIRAGVLPLLTESGVIEGIDLWRRAVARPGTSGLAADPFDALADALLAPTALPDLRDPEVSDPLNQLACELRENPAAVALRIKDALRASALRWKDTQDAALRNRETEMRAANRPDDAELARQQLESLSDPHARLRARLALVIDQFEELFTTGYSLEIQQKYVAAICGLVRSGRVFVIATLRSDFYARYQEFPELVELAKMGRFDLRPPTPTEIGAIIRRPAEAAGLTFEKDPESGEILDEAIRDAATKDPESLPLLEHALDQLFRAQAERHDDTLLWSDYENIKGLEGALAQHAEATFQELHPHEQEAFHIVMGQLVTLGRGEEEVPNRRTAQYSNFCSAGTDDDAKAGAQGFVDFFVRSRLLVADTDPKGNIVTAVAHEALLRRWDRVKAWLSSNRQFLRMRDRLDASLQIWKGRGNQKADLLQTGLALAEGEKLLAESAASLGVEHIDYIHASLAEQRRQRRRHSIIRNGVFTAVSLLAVVAGFQWLQAKLALTQKEKANRLLAENSRQASWSSFNQADLQINRGEWQEGIAHLARAVKFNPENRVAAERFFQQLILDRCRLRTPLADFRHDAKVEKAVFSPDGSRILTASDDYTAKLWDAASGEKLATFQHKDNVFTAVFSPDGSKVLTASWDKTAKLWDAASGKELTAFHHYSGVYSAVFSPDGSKVLTASADHTAKLWDAASGEELATFQHKDNVFTAVFSPDGSKVLTASWDKTAKLWDAASGKGLVAFQHEVFVNGAMFSPDGSKILTANMDKAQLWDAASGKELAVFHQDEDRGVWTHGVSRGIFSPDGSKVLTARDKTAKLWDAASGEELAVFHHDDWVYGAVFSPEGSRILSYSADKTAKLWDAVSGEELAAFHHDDELESAVFGPDGSKVLTASADKTAKLWGAVSGEELAAFHHDDELESAVFGPDGSKVLTASADHTAKLWDAASGEELATFQHKDNVFTAAFSPDDSKVLTASADHTAKLWDAASGKELATFQHKDNVFTAVFSPDGSKVLTASADHTAKLWDAASGKELATLVHFAPVKNAVFSPGGSKVLTASADHTAKLWDAASGKGFVVFQDEEFVNGAVVGRDSSKFLTLTARVDDTAKGWDAVFGKLSDFNHGGEVFSAVFSPDGSKVLTASADHTAKLWDAASGKEIAAFQHKGIIDSVVFSPDGSKVLTASRDRTARLWDASTARSLAALPGGSNWHTSDEDRNRIDSSILHQIELLSEYTSGRKLTEDGSLTSETSSRLEQLKKKLMDSATDDQPMSRFILWVCSPVEGATIFANCGVSRATWIDNQILTAPEVTEAFAREAFLALPGSPLTELGMAKFVDDSVGAKFLRKQALQRLPSDATICTRAGELLRDQEQFAEALMVADKAIAADTSSLAAHRLRSRCLDDLKRWEEALQGYQAILARSDALGSDFGEAGYVAAKMGKGNVCDSVFTQGIERCPNDPDLYYCRGWALVNLHRPIEAIRAFAMAENFLGGRDNLLGERKPTTFPVLEEAAAGAKDQAVAAYVKLINLDERWADSRFVRNLDATDVEKEALLEALAETLECHPELKPQ
jgi:WD40 repeat protein/tetratricopeptide (TPR) repeat protein